MLIMTCRIVQVNGQLSIVNKFTIHLFTIHKMMWYITTWVHFKLALQARRKIWDIPVRFLCGLCEKLCISFAVIFYRKVLRKGAQSRVKGVYIIAAGWWVHQPGRTCRGRCPHQPHEAKRCDNLEYTPVKRRTLQILLIF